jgi:hypothetical protein
MVYIKLIMSSSRLKMINDNALHGKSTQYRGIDSDNSRMMTDGSRIRIHAIRGTIIMQVAGDSPLGAIMARMAGYALPVGKR